MQVATDVSASVEEGDDEPAALALWGDYDEDYYDDGDDDDEEEDSNDLDKGSCILYNSGAKNILHKEHPRGFEKHTNTI